MGGYKRLIVYQTSKKLAIDLFNYLSEKKLIRSKEFIRDQLLKSASSIGANIAEGYGRHYKKSYRQFLGIARGSCFETEHWLEVAQKLKIIDNKTVTDFIERNNEIAKMLTSMMKKLEQSA